MKLKNFIGMSYVSRNPQFDCTRSVNLYPSLDEYQTGTNQQIMQLLSTPGLTDVLGSDPSGASVRGGWTTTTNRSFFVAGNNLYMMSGPAAPYTAQLVGTLFTTSGRVRAADNGAQMFIVDGPFGYTVDLVSLSFQHCTDPAFYGSNFVECYDGYFIFSKPGTNLFYWSNVFSTTFDALNFASKSGNADPISGFFVLQRQLWLVGTQTTEIWYDVGGNVTFQRLQGPYNETGCIAPDTIAKSENGAFWLGGNQRGGAVVLMTAGNAVQKASTGSVDYQLQLYKQYIAKSTGYCYQKDGQTFYALNPYNGTSSWFFDSTLAPLLGVLPWHERAYTVPSWESTISIPNGTQQRHLGDVSWFYNGQNLVGAYNRAEVYAFDNDNPTDDGAAITRLRQAPHVNNEGNVLFFHWFRLLAQVGMGDYVSLITNPGPIVGNTFTAAMHVGGFGDTPYLVGFAEDKYGDFGVLPYGTLTPNTVPGVGNVGMFVAGSETFNSGIPKNVHVIIESSGNVLTRNSIANVSFTDRNGNVQFYDANTAVFAYNGANTPPDGSWLWSPPTQLTYNAFVNGACTTIHIGYTSQGANVDQLVFTDPKVYLCWSDDGGFLWSDEISIPLGKVGHYNNVIEARGLGWGRNRVFRVRCTDPVQLNLMDASIGITAARA